VPDIAYAGEQIVELETAEDDVLRVEHVAKRFGPTTALRDINLHLRKGEVLALLGDNGAGKSTLIKILSGFHQPDSGSMWCKGQAYAPRTVHQARKAGIDTVFQDLALVNQLTVFQNMFLHRELTAKPLPLLRNRTMRKRTRAALDDIGIQIPSIDLPVARLSGGQRQAIAVARVISGEADVILLDEPLAAMGAKEGAQIIDLVQRLHDSGEVSIILIVHNYIQVFQVCDRVNLIQDGVITFDKPTSETSVSELNEIVVEQYRRARQEAQSTLSAEISVDAARAAVAGDDGGSANVSDAADDPSGAAPGS
jgi:simple sugar transport system ATP-binding protein